MTKNKKEHLKKAFFNDEFKEYKEKKKKIQKRNEFIAKYGFIITIISLCTLLFLPYILSPETYILIVENWGLNPLLSENFNLLQIFTSMWLHGNFFHLLINMLMLYMITKPLVSLLGNKKLSYLYILSGLVGSLLMLLFGVMYDYGIGVGASGALCGILGTMLVLYPNIDIKLFFIIPMKMKKFIYIFVMTSAIFLLFNWFPGIGHAAHLGGFITGYFLTTYWKQKKLLI